MLRISYLFRDIQASHIIRVKALESVDLFWRTPLCQSKRILERQESPNICPAPFAARLDPPDALRR